MHSDESAGTRQQTDSYTQRGKGKTLLIKQHDTKRMQKTGLQTLWEMLQRM